jgi:hypothetical protein
MSIELLAIKFNHDPHSHTGDALNIRRNATTKVSVPEWVRGMTKAEDSVAAYSIRDTKNHTITIQAKLARLVPSIAKAEIRAIQTPPPPPPKGWMSWLAKLIEQFPILWEILLFLFYRGVGHNILGVVKPTEVTFTASGETGFVDFELAKHWLTKRGIHRDIVKWRWQYRLKPTQPWTAFVDTEHTIYTVLQTPSSPWEQHPYPDMQNPWTDILDFACDWAAFRKDPDEAATAITRWINEGGTLKGSKLQYDTSSGSSQYTLIVKVQKVPTVKYEVKFEATKFVQYLRTGASSGSYVNCADCAAIVTTFSNILGCDLMSAYMCPIKDIGKSTGFGLNDIQAIGSNAWTSPFGGKFRYHEVAWKGVGGHNDPLYDACLKVDVDSDPWSTAQPHTAELPANMPFSTLAANPILPIATPFTAKSYRERLAKNHDNGIGKCKLWGARPGTNNGRRKVV